MEQEHHHLTNEALTELERLATEGDWETAQQLFATMTLPQVGHTRPAVDELALAVFAQDADRTRAAVENLRSQTVPTRRVRQNRSRESPRS